MKTLFIAQYFDNRLNLNDSSAMNEIINPMIQSGIVNEHKVISWSLGNKYVKQYIEYKLMRISQSLANKPITLYGAGAHSENLWHLLSKINIVAVADKQADKVGKKLNNIDIINIDHINTDIILISSRAWEIDIEQELNNKYPNKTIIRMYDDLAKEIISENQSYTNKIIQELSSSNYELVVYVPAEPSESLNSEQLYAIKRASKIETKIISVWWDYDDSSLDNIYMELERKTLAVSNLIIDPGHFTKTEKMYNNVFPYNRHLNSEKIKVLPTPVDKNIFFPRKKTIDVAIFGTDAARRKYWIDLLQKSFGSRFQHIGGTGITTKAIPLEDYARATGETKIIVNTQTYPFRSQCKGKVREALASQCLLIEEDNPETREFLAGCQFVQYFKTEQELINLVSYFLANPIQRESLAKSGYEWYVKNWSPEPWGQKIKKSLNNNEHSK